MRVKALQPMYYGRQMRAVGEEYDMDEREAQEVKILSLLGKIEVVKKAEEPVAPVFDAFEYKTTAFEGDKPEPAPDPQPAAEPATGERKRYYRRRDMRAEK